MKFLIIGLGSMGKRRIRNLQKHGENDIIGFDIRSDRIQEAHKIYGIRTISKFDKTLEENPDVFIISCSPEKHLEYAHYAVDHGINFFCEVNTDPPEKIIGLVNKIRKIKKKKIVAAPSCTMRYHPSILAIKNLIESNSLGKGLLLTYHSGENLEEWHPWERVMDYYVAKKETGGGRDQIIFELDWIRWIMGEVRSVMAITKKLSKINADIYDVYDLVLEFRNGAISNVLVDLIQSPPNRIFKLICENGVIYWDWMSHVVRSYNAKEKKWQEIPEQPGYKGYLVEAMYEEEMNQFIKALKGERKYPVTFENDLRLSQIAYSSEQSSRSGRKLEL